MTQRALLTAALLLLATAPAFAQTKVQWKFKKDAVFSEITNTQITQDNAMGKSQQDQTLWTVYKIVDVDKEGNATLLKTVKRIKAVIDNPAMGGEITYDSASEEEPVGMAAMFAQQLKPLVDSTVKLKMKPSGEIYDVELSEGIANATAKLGMKTKDSAIIFPESLKAGQTWNSDMDMDTGAMHIKSTTTYTYTGEKDGKETFGVALNMEFIPVAGAPVQIKVTKQNSKGHMIFDAAKGWTHSMEVLSELVMAIQGPQGNMEQSTKTHVRTRYVDGEDTKTPFDGEAAKTGEGKEAPKSRPTTGNDREF